jgi:hypothetical protein
MSKHTPGPWVAELCEGLPEDPVRFILRQDTSGQHDFICKVYDKKDAHLIAAAPELLEAAKAAMDYMNCVTDYKYMSDLPALIQKNLSLKNKLEEAINKAEGKQ